MRTPYREAFFLRRGDLPILKISRPFSEEDSSWDRQVGSEPSFFLIGGDVLPDELRSRSMQDLARAVFLSPCERAFRSEEEAPAPAGHELNFSFLSVTPSGIPHHGRSDSLLRGMPYFLVGSLDRGSAHHCLASLHVLFRAVKWERRCTQL